ncbi:unnamed protein product [Urochloa humidicola]
MSGAIHYPSSTPEMWPDLISKVKQGGLNTIKTSSEMLTSRAPDSTISMATTTSSGSSKRSRTPGCTPFSASAPMSAPNGTMEAFLLGCVTSLACSSDCIMSL